MLHAMKPLLLLHFTVAAATVLAAPPDPKFHAQDLDKTVQIGYGIAIADVDGDKLPDILLADKTQFRWYKNPGKRGAEWPKYVLAENLTKNDNVCIAAQDIDGDGKCEIAVGAEWNPGDTVNSGAVFYLIPPADRTQKWEPVKFPSVEPTTHRMRWLQIGEKQWGLVVVPLHGRGNKNGEGAAAKTLLYLPPTDPKAEWKSVVIDESMHATHNFVPRGVRLSVQADGRKFMSAPSVALAGKEGILALTGGATPEAGSWSSRKVIWAPPAAGKEESPLMPVADFKGAGELKFGRLPLSGGELMVTVEPMHGNQLVAYARPGGKPVRHVLTDKLLQGHALACGDLLGLGSDQVVVGWRGNIPPKPEDQVGIALWTPLDDSGELWRETVVDKNETACEDLTLADLDGDGKPDIIAAGRATHNLRILWNDR